MSINRMPVSGPNTDRGKPACREIGVVYRNRGRHEPLGRHRNIALLAVAVAAASMQPARAQVIDSYFPPTGTAAGGIPADNSRTRIAAEYLPLGIRIGDFLFDPQLSESVGYDSNVNGLGDAASAVIDTSASVIARSDWSRQSLSAELTVDDRRYPSLPNQSSTSWTGNLAGTYDLGRDQLGVTYEHLALVETPDQIESATTLPLPYRVDALLGSYSMASNGRFSFLPSISLQRYNFDSIVIPGTNDNESWRDRETIVEELATRYQLDPGQDVLLVLRGTEIRYDNAVPAVPRLDSNGASVLLGIDYSATDVFRYRALVGYQLREFVSPAYEQLSAPIAEASLTWTPTRLNTITFTLLRDIEDSQSEGDTAFTYTTARIDISHELRRNITLAAFAAFQNADTNASPAGSLVSAVRSANQTIYSAGLSAAWKLNRLLSLNASFSYTESRGKDARDYNEGVGLLTLGISP